ncbi:MAG TPA: transketolase C-terminal domain-containing protein, partial [Methylomirabilota bacterium]|nr:transketolase C-terminal domain-containing protein [Methylomirabilota bacterium]
FADFVTCAMDEVANQVAKSRYMFGGQISCPLALRMPYGIGKSAGGHHSNSVEAWFVNIPGLKVCIPSNPADARALLKTAIRDTDPVLVFEHRGLYRVTGEVPEAETLVPLGRADVKRRGTDVTVIATARMVGESLDAASRLAVEGISVEVVDPRSLVPLDREGLVASVRKTHRVVIAEEGPMRGSVGAWLAWVIMEDCFDDLDAPIARVAGPNIPIPFSPPLEAFATPGAADVIDAVRRVTKCTCGATPHRQQQAHAPRPPQINKLFLQRKCAGPEQCLGDGCPQHHEHVLVAELVAHDEEALLQVREPEGARHDRDIRQRGPSDHEAQDQEDPAQAVRHDHVPGADLGQGDVHRALLLDELHRADHHERQIGVGDVDPAEDHPQHQRAVWLEPASCHR